MLGKAIEAKDVEFGCRTEIDTRTGSAAQEIDGRSATAGTQRDGDREELERNARNAGRAAAGVAEYHVCSDICVFVRLGKAYCLSLSGDWIGIAIAECPGAAEACLQRCVVCV